MQVISHETIAARLDKDSVIDAPTTLVAEIREHLVRGKTDLVHSTQAFGVRENRSSTPTKGADPGTTVLDTPTKPAASD